MALSRVFAFWRGGLVTVLLAGFAAACTEEEPPTPFKRVFRSAVENSENRGFVWVAKKPGQPDPDGRYEGGYDVDFHAGLGVCRMRHEGGVHPGKVFAGKCNAGYGHKEISSNEYDLLVARQDAFWHMTPKPGMELDKVLVAGREADGKPLKLCVARHRTGWWLFANHRGYHPGKYVHGKCNIGFGGQEIAADEFYLAAFGSRPVLEVAGGAPEGGAGDAATAASSPEAGALASPDAGAPQGTPRNAAPAAADEERADSGARATLPASVTTAPRKRAAPVRPVSCLPGEVPCHCDKLSGCTVEGFCPCSS